MEAAENMKQGPEGEAAEKIVKLGLPLEELYALALLFYREKSGKAIHISYEDNLKLVAFAQQASNGPFVAAKAPPLGVLDVIGKDRRTAWQSLGSLSKSQSMEGFVILLSKLCPTLEPYLEAVRRDKEARICLENENRQRELQEKQREKAEALKTEEIKNNSELQRRQLQDILNQQTFYQFKAYAEKQFPRNPEQQAILIRQLQSEHYHQYMQQIRARSESEENVPADETKEEVNTTALETRGEDSSMENECCEEDSRSSTAGMDGGQNYGVVSPAKMWTRPNIKAFKAEVSSGSGDGVINIEHGETVTVRVPTHEAGNCIFWEFSTDDYDIGFGVYFEWGKPATNDVTVHVSDSDEDEEIYDEMDDGDDYFESRDLESSAAAMSYNSRNPISIIVPIYRRECHKEVYVGSHIYPGQGVYLLKFDNSFSIWRSKTLYYKVYYERSL